MPTKQHGADRDEDSTTGRDERREPLLERHAGEMGDGHR
jgi:hypothetical protein